MRPRRNTYYLAIGLLFVVALLAIGGGVYFGTDLLAPSPSPEVALPPLETPTSPPTATVSPTPGSTPTVTPATSTTPTATTRPELPAGGIVYALTPDINSVGWVQAGEAGNHFGESYLNSGLREGITYHGAMQFDLSFIPKGSTIFMAELDLTGLVENGLTEDSVFNVNILKPEIDEGWSRLGYQAINEAAVEEVLTPPLEASELGRGQVNSYTFDAAKRSIIEDRLESSALISFRIDSIFPEGWFAWDSGYGDDSQGQGPVLRLGVIPPVATEVADVAAADTTPTATGTLVVVTSTPTPENNQTAAAVAPTVTYEATMIGTVTPLPPNWVTPIIVTATPVPENTATAVFQVAEATAVVIAFGTVTPTPGNLMVATPTPTETATPIFILLDGELPPMTPTPTPVATLGPTPPIPAELIGKIAFKSDRTGREELYVINPDGTGLALLTNPWPYNMANLADTFSGDGRYRVFTKGTIRYNRISNPDGTVKTVAEPEIPTLFWYDSVFKIEEQLSFFGAGIAYNGVWSPTGEQIALVSTESGNDEIWVISPDGSTQRQLTKDDYSWWDKHPSWSPDGNQIVFWSNRTGHGQIWIMDADGSNLYSLSRTGFNDFDPVWIKSPGLPPDALKKHIPYHGPYDPSGSEKSCSDFDPLAEFYESAQTFYWAAGGPARDPHNLDSDQDGLACD